MVGKKRMPTSRVIAPTHVPGGAPGVAVAGFQVAVAAHLEGRADHLHEDDGEADPGGPAHDLTDLGEFAPEQGGDGHLEEQHGGAQRGQQRQPRAEEDAGAEDGPLALPVAAGHRLRQLAGQGGPDPDVQHVDEPHRQGDGGVDAEQLHTQQPDGDGDGHQPQHDGPELGNQRGHHGEPDGPVAMGSGIGWQGRGAHGRRGGNRRLRRFPLSHFAPEIQILINIIINERLGLLCSVVSIRIEAWLATRSMRSGGSPFSPAWAWRGAITR